MKPHPRIRKTIKWGSAAVTVLLVVVWIGSGWCSLTRERSDGWVFMVGEGSLFVHHRPGAQPIRGLGWNPIFRHHPIWQPPSWASTPLYWNIVIPLWVLALGSGSAAFAAWRLDTLARRRAKLNLCPKCGYDRTGILKDAKCPECGSGGVPA